MVPMAMDVHYDSPHPWTLDKLYDLFLGQTCRSLVLGFDHGSLIY